MPGSLVAGGNGGLWTLALAADRNDTTYAIRSGSSVNRAPHGSERFRRGGRRRTEWHCRPRFSWLYGFVHSPPMFVAEPTEQDCVVCRQQVSEPFVEETSVEEISVPPQYQSSHT